jgi:hypothetical protein
MSRLKHGGFFIVCMPFNNFMNIYQPYWEIQARTVITYWKGETLGLGMGMCLITLTLNQGYWYEATETFHLVWKRCTLLSKSRTNKKRSSRSRGCKLVGFTLPMQSVPITTKVVSSNPPYKTMFGSSVPPVVCSRGHVLFTLFVFVFYIVVPNTYSVVFLFCLSSSCVLCSFYVSHLHFIPNDNMLKWNVLVSNFFGMSIFDCPFGIL